MAPQRTTIKKAEWIKKIVDNPANPPKVLMVTGCFGDSPTQGQTRIYLNADLSEYVDVPDDAIRHSEEIAGTSVPGMSHIWIDQETEVVHEPVMDTAPRKAKFLEGRIAQGHVRRALAQVGQIGAAIPPAARFFPSTHIRCRSEIDACPSALIQCESQLVACAPSKFTTCTIPSRFSFCGSQVDACPSALVQCESQFVACTPSRLAGCGGNSKFIRCGSAIDACPSALIDCGFDPGIGGGRF